MRSLWWSEGRELGVADSANRRYTQRLARQVGLLCREMSNKAVGEALHLDAETVKE